MPGDQHRGGVVVLKKYEGRSMKEALAAVKQDLGADALIVSTREIKSIFGRKTVEVTAMDDPEGSIRSPESSSRGDSIRRPDREQRTSLRRPLKPSRGHRGRSASVNRYVQQQRVPDLSSMPLSETLLAQRSASSSASSQMRYSTHESDYLQEQDFEINTHLRTLLDACDIDLEIARDMIQESLASAFIDAASLNQPYPIDELRKVIAHSLNATTLRAGRKSIVALVGPTGVGKTTTIAKLAACASLMDGVRVGLVTTDTYRIGAVDQLHHYASLIGIPLEVAQDKRDLARAIHALSSCDLLFVDTAGRNPGDWEQLAQLVEIFDMRVNGLSIQTHLVLAASTRMVEMRSIVERYRPFHPQSIIFTKLDEALALGGIVNAAWQSKLPISYITDGQRVPEDLDPANASKLAGMMLDRAQDLIQKNQSHHRALPKFEPNNPSMWGAE